MKKKMSIFLVPFLLISCATATSIDRAAEKIAWDTIDLISDTGKPVIAVYNFMDITENGDINELLVNRLTTELANAVRYEEKNIIIVSRQVFNQVFQEHSFILSDLTDQKKQIEIGLLLGANYILTGDLSRNKDIFFINTQLVNIESGEVLGGDSLQFWVEIPTD